MIPGQVLSAPRLDVAERPDEFRLSWGESRAPFAERLASLCRLMDRLDEKLPVRDARRRYATKVSFEESRHYPVHRWYYYKEGYSPELLQLIVRELNLKNELAILDPFAGVGTTVLSASQLRTPGCHLALGIEHNPFAVFVARTKLAWRELNPTRLRDLGLAVAAHQPATMPDPPPSATLNNRDIYPRHVLTELLRMREAIEELATEHPHRRALRLALASVLESVSYAKKDGRALRIVNKENVLRPRVAFVEAARKMADDVVRLSATPRPKSAGEYAVQRADARNLDHLEQESFDLALYSPPYLNGIDYSEVYKVEEWFLGFVQTERDLYKLRKGTLRSHASIRFEETNIVRDALTSQHLVVRLLSEFASFIAQEEPRAFQSQYAWLVPAYFDDMFLTLKGQYRALRPGGHAVCVVANSTFASVFRDRAPGGKPKERWRIPLATDAILAELAREIGFRVRAALAVRSLRPRNVRGASSRETILVLQRPRG